MPTYKCSRCPAQVEAKTQRLPRGWKDYGGPVCGACLVAGYSIRAITLPVAGIVGRIDRETDEPEPVEQGTFLRHFMDSWHQATDLANWAMRELAQRDVRRAPGMTTLPKYDAKAMFGENPRRIARKNAAPTQVETLYSTWNTIMPLPWRQLWDGAAGTAGTILKQVEDTWKNHPSFGRFAVLWRGHARPMVYRFPAPWPVRNADWRVRWELLAGQRRPLLSVPVAGGYRLVLELDRSPELRRQLADFDSLVTGSAIGGDVKLCPIERGGRIVGVKAVIAGRFPRASLPENGDLVAVCRTGAESLLTVAIDGRDDWVLSGDQVRGAVYAHDRWLARYRNDMKHEKRWPKRRLKRMVAGGAKAHIDRHHGRVTSEIQQMSAAVVGYAARQRCKVLCYRDHERGFLPSFPWFALRECLSCLCASEGIRFDHEAGSELIAS